MGNAFDKRQFQEALGVGRLGQISVLVKCYHSWCYYPTRVGRPHPDLRCDLLGAQIEASHEVGVRAPIYVTVGWSASDAEEHPDWCMRDSEGGFVNRNWPETVRAEEPKPTFQWRVLCVGGPYHAHLVCHCVYCRRGMVKAGMDPRDATDAERYRALRLLHDRPVVQAGLPSAGRVSLLRQRREGRYVAHLLYCPPIARGRCLVLEDFPRLADVPVVLRLPGTVRALCLEPDGIPLPFDRRTETSGFLAGSDVVTTRVPSFAMHCAVVADLVSAAG